jgi:acetyl-CoA C-acetyltransferase
LEPDPRLPAAQTPADEFAGAATIEAYTVPCDREGNPEAVIICARAADGRRTLVRDSEPALLATVMGPEEPLGRKITVVDGSRVELLD